MAAHDHRGNAAGSSAEKAKHSHSSGTSDKMKAAASAGTHQHGHGAGAGDGHAHGGMHSQAQVVNPIKPSEASVKKGHQLFNVYCSVCHGTEGRGGTPMAGKIPGIPKFTPELLRKVDDNHMFSMVTSGHGPMPGYGEALTPEERWHVTNYVRTLPDKLAEKKAPVRQGASR
jgi:mono/diheme cytochrome c family protein